MLNDRNKLIFFLFPAMFFASGCSYLLNSPSEQTPAIKIQNPLNDRNNSEQTDFSEPKPDGALFAERYTEQIKKAWREFTADGKYRLAKKDELKFSQAAWRKKGADASRLFTPFAYVWGGLNYPRKNPDDILAAIVVDTNRNDANKYSLVIFSPPQNNSNNYKVNWLYRNKDLSSFALEAPSGYLIVQRYNEDGTNEGCFVNWNKKLNRFQCK